MSMFYAGTDWPQKHFGKTLHNFKKASIALKMYLKSLAVLEKSLNFPEKVQK
jgi:hypothetical protein